MFYNLDSEASYWPLLSRWWVGHWGWHTNSIQCSCGTEPRVKTQKHFKRRVFKNSPTMKSMHEKRTFNAKCELAGGLFLAGTANIIVLCFPLPRCKCHQGCIQAQRPVGRASWPVALCTSSLPHIWMYLRGNRKSPDSAHIITESHESTHSSNIFLCCRNQNNPIKDVKSHWW